MTCGCGPSQDFAQCQIGFTSPMLQSRAAMCVACPHRDGNGCGIGYIACTVQIAEGRCPAKRFPNGKMLVRWLGVNWRGVPMPLRWKLAWMLRKNPMRKKLPGCGCIDRLATYWEWLVQRFTMRKTASAKAGSQ